MARNRFAQPLYGKIIYIYETDLEKDQLATIFDPGTYWIDVSGFDVEVGYILEYVEGGGVRLVPPQNEGRLSLKETKAIKIALMKAERDNREVAVIDYKDITLDYDDKARERMRIAQQALEDNNIESQLWTCADNVQVLLTVQDFKNINTLAAQRSGALHVQYNKLKEYINSLTTIEEVDVVTFDTEVPEATEDIVEETIHSEENQLKEV